MPSGSSIKTRFLRSGGILIAALLWTQSADAHGIAGNRYFAGTITFDDPAVADELILPNFSYLESPAQGSNVAENRINGAFARLLTPTLAFTIDSPSPKPLPISGVCAGRQMQLATDRALP